MLTTVADAANADGKHAHPGIEGVMRGSLYGRRQSIAILDELVQEGWLSIEEEGGGRGLATVYALPKMADVNGAVVAPKATETVQSSTERVQSDDETVQSRVHPNGLSNVTTQRSGRRSSFPAAFILTEEMRQWHQANTPEVDLRLETTQFADHHRAKEDKMVRWDLAWRTWMRNADRWRKPANGRGGPAKIVQGPDHFTAIHSDEEWEAHLASEAR